MSLQIVPLAIVIFIFILNIALLGMDANKYLLISINGIVAGGLTFLLLNRLIKKIE